MCELYVCRYFQAQQKSNAGWPVLRLIRKWPILYYYSVILSQLLSPFPISSGFFARYVAKSWDSPTYLTKLQYFTSTNSLAWYYLIVKYILTVLKSLGMLVFPLPKLGNHRTFDLIICSLHSMLK